MARNYDSYALFFNENKMPKEKRVTARDLAEMANKNLGRDIDKMVDRLIDECKLVAMLGGFSTIVDIEYKGRAKVVEELESRGIKAVYIASWCSGDTCRYELSWGEK